VGVLPYDRNINLAGGENQPKNASDQVAHFQTEDVKRAIANARAGRKDRVVVQVPRRHHHRQDERSSDLDQGGRIGRSLAAFAASGGVFSSRRFGETSRRSGRAIERPRRRMAGRLGCEPR
jgi:glutamate synthase domain-containing protein 3